MWMELRRGAKAGALAKSGLALCAILVLAAPSSASAASRSYAFIIANNQSLIPWREPLRFADDDGAKYAELFALHAQEVRLYTVMDADTQRLYPKLVSRSLPPKRDAILAGLQEAFAAMRRDRSDGHEVTFYFIFSGHGEVESNAEGYVHLLDGRWTRTDLYEQVIAASPATYNHVVIDACNAYFMVAQRGTQATSAGDYSRLIRDFTSRERLAQYPNTGVMLSTASAAEVHEWGKVQAGIFSHELRSALSGAGDVTADSALSYDEIAAYIAAANAGLPDPKTRLRIFTRPPAQNVNEPFLVLEERGTHVTLPQEWSGHFYLEDDRGVRAVDFHKSSEVGMRLSLVPRERYYLRGERKELLIEPAEAGAEVALAAVDERPLTLAARGATHDAFDRYLFAIPFGPSFLQGHQEAALRFTDVETELITLERPLRPWIYTTGALAGGLAITSGVMTGFAYDAAAQYRTSSGSAAQIETVRRRAEDYQVAAVTTASMAVTSAAVALILFWLEE